MKSTATKLILAVLTTVVLSSSLSACGKRSAPIPPTDEPITYPKAYPSDNK